MKRTLRRAGATLAKLAAALILGTLGARAQVPFSVSIERPERVLDTSAFTTFEVHVMSEASTPIRVRAVRVLNDLPDSDWYTTICSKTTCYPVEVDTTNFESAPPGTMTGFTIHLFTGRLYGDSARVRLQIDTGSADAAVVREVLVVTAPPPVQLFRVETAELERNAVVGEIVEFTVWAYNQASDTLALIVERAEDYYSSDGWESSLCVESDCFDPDVTVPPGVRLDNDKATYFRLRVRPGAPGQGRIVLRINTGRGTEPIEKRFTVNAGVASAEPGSARSALTAVGYPNPTTGLLSVELPGDFRLTESTRIELADVSGRIVEIHLSGKAGATDRGVMRFDLSGHPAGRYLIRVHDGNESFSVPVLLSE